MVSLNICNDNSFSLFEIFKKTKTIGGRQRMEDIMKAPSNDICHLIERRDAIDYFINSALELDISNDHFNLILHYINYDKGRIRPNLIDSFIVFLSINLIHLYF